MGSGPALVIFDCDGVLVDTERLCVPIDAELLAKAGWPLTTDEVIDLFLGRSEADCLIVVAERLGKTAAAELAVESDRRYQEAFERELEPVAGVTELLDGLDAAGIPTCVASSGRHGRIRMTLGLTGLYERFEGRIFSAEDVARGKPQPDLFQHAAAAMGAEPHRCAVVEDSRYGLEAALAAGMRAFAYAGGLTPPARLTIPGAVLFESMEELPALLGLRAN